MFNDNENTEAKQASRMHEVRKASGLPSSIPLCMRTIYPYCALTDSQVNTLRKTFAQF